MKKIKNNIVCFTASLVTTVIPVIVGLILWNKLPEQIALLFHFDGNPDSYYSKGFAVFGVYLMILAVQIFVAVGTASENEKGEGIPEKLYCIFLWICPVISVLMSVLVYGNALGYELDVVFWCMMAIGFLYLVLGNYVPKLRRNKFSGLRVKWTFESKKNWEHTNRFSGYVMCVLGIVTIIMALTRFYNVATAYWMPVVWFALIFVSEIVMMVYSYVYYTKHKNDEDYFDKTE